MVSLKMHLFCTKGSAMPTQYHLLKITVFLKAGWAKPTQYTVLNYLLEENTGYVGTSRQRRFGVGRRRELEKRKSSMQV
jgi:hypothetical protein